MIIIMKIIVLIIAFFVLAFLLGGLFVVPLSEKKHSLILMVIMGTFVMFAGLEILALPMIILQLPFYNLVFGWLIEMVLLGLFSFFLNGKKIIRMIQKTHVSRNGFLWAAFAVIALQILLISFFSNVDAKLVDPVAIAGEAYFDNTMMMKDPATGNDILDFGQTWQSKALSPIMLLWALLARVIQVHPSIFIFSVLPFIIIPITYLGYWLLGEQLFKSRPDKSGLFLLLIAVFHILAYPVGYTQSFNLLAGYFRGESIFYNFMFPMVFYLLFCYMMDKDKKILGMLLLTMVASMSVWWQGAFLELITVFIYFSIDLFGEKAVLFGKDIRNIFRKNKMDHKEIKGSEHTDRKGDIADMKMWKIVLPVFLLFVALTIGAVYKVNSKINSVFEITQEMKSEMAAWKTELDTKTTQGGNPDETTLSGSGVDDSTSVSLASAPKNEIGYRDITRFTESDGTTYITYDTGSEDVYRIYQPDMNEDAGGMGYIIELPNGELVVVDGGYYGDGVKLHDFIKEHGGVVSAWYLTHPHYDHIGAFLYCMSDEAKSDLSVKKVYYSPFTETYFTQESNKLDMQVEDEALKFSEFNQLVKKDDRDVFVPLQLGDKVETQGLKVECLWSFDEKVEDINNNSLVLRMDMNGVIMMFTGDIMEDTLDRMIHTFGEDSPKWKTDFIQIPHHGYEGMSSKLYQLTEPAFALLDCSTSEYEENILGIKDNTVESIHNMGIGVVKRFEGTNVIILK